MSEKKETGASQLTLRSIKNARELLNKPPEPFIEVYPLQYKNDSELGPLCEARVKAGLGIWAQEQVEEIQWFSTKQEQE